MTRTENDLRDALRELEQRADQHGAPSIASILSAKTVDQRARRRDSVSQRFPRWLPPLAVAAVVATTAVTAVTLSTQHSGSPRPHAHQAGGQVAGTQAGAHRTPTGSPDPAAKSDEATSVATILDDAAAKLDDARTWTTPSPQDFFYVRTTQATTWTSVSGTQPGAGQAADGSQVVVPGCEHGQIVSTKESGTCSLNDVPHYLGDAPTAPSAWDAYLEQIAPGSKAAGAQGKIIVEVLHQDLVAPKAAAALLRYTASCPGEHTLTVRPVAGEKLIGVTCSSMTNGSYGLAFDAASHRLVGFVVVTPRGQQDGPAEIIRQTGVVAAIGRTP